VQSMNNLKQIGTAMHNHRSAMRRFPADITDEDGKPLLSWRVKILPYVEQKPLYDALHLDEPWNSPHNMRLLGSMPDVYRAPRADPPKGGTTYLGVAGKDGVFSDPRGTRIRDITDGTSNTIAVVQVADSRAVPWTKPQDFEYDEDDPIAGLVNPWDMQFHAAMCDGSVHALHEGLDPQVLKALFTRSGGEIANGEEIRDPQRYPRRSYNEKPAKRPTSEPVSPHGAASPDGMPGTMPAPHDQPSGGVADPSLGSVVRLRSLAMTAPEGWVRERPTPRITQGLNFTPDAEFRLPRAGDDETDGHLTVSTVGGNMAMNVDRWKNQFAKQGREFSQEQLDVGGVPVVVVDISGTVVMMGEPHVGTDGGIPNMRMLGAIIPGRGRSHFVKARGLKDTMAKHQQPFRQFIESLQPAEEIETAEN